MATNSPTDHDAYESNVLRRFYNKIEEVIDPAVVARKLWQDGVLTEAQLDEAELASTSLDQRKSDLMSAVRKVVRGDSGKIRLLVETLEQFPASRPIARTMIGSAMKKIACHRFGWMVFQRVQCFDPNTKRTNRKTQTPSYL